MKNIVLSIMTHWCLVTIACGATWYVAVDGVDGGAGTNWHTAVRTVKHAVDTLAVNAGDVVIISNGVYMLGETIAISQGITLRGFGADPRDVALNGGNTIRCLQMNHPDVTLENLTVTNGRQGVLMGTTSASGGIISNCHIVGNSFGEGAGVLMSSGGRVYNSHFYGNNSSSDGGAVAVRYVSTGRTGLIDGCFIYSNTAVTSGAGIFVRNTILVINNCVIINNQAGSGGGGVYCENYDAAHSMHLMHSTIAGNTSAVAAGVHVYRGNGIIDGLIISNNTASGQCGGVRLDSPRTAGHNRSILRNTTVVNNQSAGYGGGIRAESAILTNCIVRGNVSTHLSGYGGGIYAAGNTAMRGCLIAGNTNLQDTAHGGGGIICIGMTGEVHNCTIAGNSTAFSGGGVYFFDSAVNQWVNCIIYANNSGISGTEDIGNSAGMTGITNYFSHTCSTRILKPEVGNILADPAFADSQYRLASGSPCVNAGLIQSWMYGALDLDGHMRIDRFSGLVDMGCYEHRSQGTMCIVR